MRPRWLALVRSFHAGVEARPVTARCWSEQSGVYTVCIAEDGYTHLYFYEEDIHEARDLSFQRSWVAVLMSSGEIERRMYGFLVELAAAQVSVADEHAMLAEYERAAWIRDPPDGYIVHRNAYVALNIADLYAALERSARSRSMEPYLDIVRESYVHMVVVEHAVKMLYMVAIEHADRIAFLLAQRCRVYARPELLRRLLRLAASSRDGIEITAAASVVLNELGVDDPDANTCAWQTIVEETLRAARETREQPILVGITTLTEGGHRFDGCEVLQHLSEIGYLLPERDSAQLRYVCMLDS